MNQSILSVRVDKNDKKDFEHFCNETGMNISTAINMFIKRVIRDQKLPFEVSSKNDVLTDEEILEKLKEAEEAMANGAKTYSMEEAHKKMDEILEKYV